MHRQGCLKDRQLGVKYGDLLFFAQSRSSGAKAAPSARITQETSAREATASVFRFPMTVTQALSPGAFPHGDTEEITAEHFCDVPVSLSCILQLKTIFFYKILYRSHLSHILSAQFQSQFPDGVLQILQILRPMRPEASISVVM